MSTRLYPDRADPLFELPRVLEMFLDLAEHFVDTHLNARAPISHLRQKPDAGIVAHSLHLSKGLAAAARSLEADESRFL